MESGETSLPVLTLPRPAPRPVVKQPRLWNVVLLNDDDHSYEYVIEMMVRVFGKSLRDGLEVAKTVDKQGRAICLTTHRELGELKVEQVHSYGKDTLIAGCKGSMSALLELADLDGGEPGR